MKDSHIITGIVGFGIVGTGIGAWIALKPAATTEVAVNPIPSPTHVSKLVAPQQNRPSPTNDDRLKESKAAAVRQRQMDEENAIAARQVVEKARMDRIEADRVAQVTKAREIEEKAKLRGTLSGVAWIVRNGGTSDVQRSLHVLIVRPVVNRESLAAILRGQAAYEQEQSQEAIKSAKRFESSPDIKKEYLDKANEHSRQSKTTIALIRSLPLQMKMDDARDFSKKNAPMMSFAGCPESAIVAQGKTDIDGKYSIPNIRTGDYYLYAHINTNVLSAEWLLPIHVEGDAQKIDLDNDNASKITN